MKVIGSLRSRIKATPSSGDLFGGSINYEEQYARPADYFYLRNLPLFCISPPVLNCDDVVFYEFPTAGSTSMLGRQTSGLWIGESSVDSGVFYTGNYTFDTKVAAGRIFYDTRTYIYQIADGSETRAGITQQRELDITDYTTTNPVTSNIPRVIFGGNPLSDPNYASFARKDPAIEKYELQYGTGGTANYGPFNISTSDLVSVSSLVNEDFRQVSLGNNVPNGEARRIVTETPSAMISDQDPWTLSSKTEFSIENESTINVHISLARGWILGEV